MEIGDWIRVESSYDRMARVDPEHYAPLMYRAAYHECRGELEEALVYYKKALLLNPRNEALKSNVSRLHNEASVESTSAPVVWGSLQL